MELVSQAGVPQSRETKHAHHRFATIFSGPLAAGRLASPGRPTTMTFSLREQGGDELTVNALVPKPKAGGERTDLDAEGYEVLLEGPAGSLSAVFPPPTGKDGVARDLMADPRLLRFASAVYLHLEANEMTGTSFLEEEQPRMASDGAFLASTLAWMKGAAEEELDQLTKELARIVPGVKRIRTLRERVTERRFQKMTVDGQPIWRPKDETVLGDRFEIEFDDGTSVPADLLSEGTVLALGLLTKIHEPERPRLVLLDDIDRGLHIEAQARFVEVLRDLQKLDENLQIVCTTHSPYLLDRFEPSEVRMLALDANRQTRVLPLMEHPEFEKWKFGTQTGELWAALGDAWANQVGEQGE
jgi:hypothetical protein